MRSSRTVFILALALLVLTCGGLLADTAIYGGQPISEAGIALSSWGSGSAQESADKSLTGSKSIKVEAQGWFAGAAIDFTTPVALSSGVPQKSDYLVLTIAPTVRAETPGVASTKEWYSRIAPPLSTGSPAFGAETVQASKVRQVRLILISDKGKRTEVLSPVGPLTDASWANVAVPIVKLDSGEDGYRLKRLLFFTDVPDTVYIGTIRVAQDVQPLHADPVWDQSMAVGDNLQFRANATNGLAGTKCHWDFDSRDGTQEDAVGDYVRHTYKIAGDYVVTLTVSDPDGLKPPVTKSLKVHIE